MNLDTPIVDVFCLIDNVEKTIEPTALRVIYFAVVFNKLENIIRIVSCGLPASVIAFDRFPQITVPLVTAGQFADAAAKTF